MDNPKIFIGENGFPEEEGIDDSEKKIAYHTGILNKLLEALDENINVFGYCVWSFIDTLEFTFGYWKRFGIYAVDFNDDSRPRSKKNSFPFFQQLFQTKKLPIKN
ncbi:myrosinase 1-like [Aphis craccivora]|uniref:Myrosinase 1-like n=2 Tax=Aphis craccivora TaxID=307492 RepID=A0A6G0W4Z0_APHCR|nr:myrosinase 1-like [Aphis craccivora]